MYGLNCLLVEPCGLVFLTSAIGKSEVKVTAEYAALLATRFIRDKC
jgi:hypothetical protein